MGYLFDFQGNKYSYEYLREYMRNHKLIEIYHYVKYFDMSQIKTTEYRFIPKDESIEPYEEYGNAYEWDIESFAKKFEMSPEVAAIKFLNGKVYVKSTEVDSHCNEDTCEYWH